MGLSSDGGSKVIQHWDRQGDRPQRAITVTDALKTGKIDVLDAVAYLFPRRRHRKVHQPGPGAQQGHSRRRPADLAAAWDIYEPTTKVPAKVDNDAISIERAAAAARGLFQGHGRVHHQREQKLEPHGPL